MAKRFRSFSQSLKEQAPPEEGREAPGGRFVSSTPKKPTKPAPLVTSEETVDEMAGANMNTRDVHHHLKKSGWSLSRSAGGHDVYTHPKSSEHIAVPRHKQLKAPLILGIMKAAKRVQEEVEQIDEISAETKSSYVTKAKAQVKEMQPHTKGEYRSFAKSIIAKRKAGIAMAKEEVVAEEVEQIEEGRPSQQHPIEGHEYHKKSDAELRYIMKDAGAAAKAMKDHSPRAESKYLDQVNDASTVLSFRQRNGTPTWYKKKYGHVKESVDTPPFTPDAPKKNSGVVKGKRPEGMSKARHLARMAIQGQLKVKKPVNESRKAEIVREVMESSSMKRLMTKANQIEARKKKDAETAKRVSGKKESDDKFQSEPEFSGASSRVTNSSQS